MATNIEELLAQTRGGGEFLAKDEKDALVESETPFVFVGATPIREGGTFGAETIYRIKIKGEDGERLLSLSHNQSREALAVAINAAIGNGEAFVGPVVLTRIRTGKGNPYFDFAAAGAAPTPAPAAKPPKPAGNAEKTPSGKPDPDQGDLPW